MTRQRRKSAGSLPLLAIRLDPVLWQALRDIAAKQGRTVDELMIDIARDSLPLAIGIYIDEFYRSEITPPPDE